MPYKVTLINTIQRELHELVRMQKHSKTFDFFPSSDKADNLHALIKSLNLTDTMSIDDLAIAINLIETITVKNNIFTADTTMEQWLDTNRHRVLKNLIPAVNNKASTITAEKDSALFKLLVKSHKALLNAYEVAKARARGELPLSQVEYNKTQMVSSQSFRGLNETSQELALPDRATIVTDLQRKNVSIEGYQVEPSDYDNGDNSKIIKKIEEFAGDDVSVAHSRANKIYNMGGQYLFAKVLKEFTNTTHQVGNPDLIQPQAIKGTTQWRQDPQTKELYALVNIDVFTCLSLDATNKKPPQSLIIGSDGMSLVPVDSDDMEQINQRYKAQKNTDAPLMTPVSRLTAKIGLVPDKQGYHLEVKEFSNKIFTDALVSSRAAVNIPLDQQQSMPRV